MDRNVNLPMTPDGRLTLLRAADYLGIAPRTLRNWKYRGLAPRSVKVGGRVFFYVSDLQAFVADVTPVSSSTWT